MSFTFLDGSTGVHLIAAGMPSGACPEAWLLENPDVGKKLLRSYAAAGSNIVLAPTFGAVAPKLRRFGLEALTGEMNFRLVRLAVEAVGGKSKVFGDISPCGEFTKPLGDLSVAELTEIYARQVDAFIRAGADGAAIETQMNPADFRAAAAACRNRNLPFYITITVGAGGRTLSGCTVACAAIMAQHEGAFAFGMNCCAGPELIEKHLGEAREVCRLPLIAKPNAGAPDAAGNHSMTPGDFAAHIPALVAAGASILGGCCGTGPEHIAAVVAACKGLSAPEPDPSVTEYVCSRSRFLPADGLALSEELPADDSLTESAAELPPETAALISISDSKQLECYIDALPMISAPIALHCPDKSIREQALACTDGVCLIV